MAFLTEAANRGSISTGFNIDNSLKLESDNNEHLYVTTMTSGNRRTWTYSIWFKRTELGFTNVLIHFGVNNQATRMMIDDTDQLFVDIADTGSTLYRSITNRLFRDTSAWYHVVLRVDTTQGTEADRMKVYINGVEETSWSQHQIPPQNLDTLANTTAGGYDAMGIGTYVWAGSNYDGQFSGYISQVAHVDGQSYAATEFGEFDDDTGIWKPKNITGLTYGSSNNSFLLDFSTSSDLGNDSSGNNNDWSLTNIAAADQATDTPTNNFCTLLGQQQDAAAGTEPSIKEGGTTMFGGVSSTQNAVGTMGVRSGKWYFESTITNSGGVGTENHNFGVVAADQLYFISTNGYDLGKSPSAWASASNSSPRNNDAAASGANATSALAVDKIMGCAVDMDNGKIWWHNEGTWHSLNSTVGNPANGTTPAFSNLLTATDEPLLPAGGFYINNNNQVRVMNFGGYAQAVFTAVGTYADADGYGSFAYQPPSGYYALCTKNLAEYG